MQQRQVLAGGQLSPQGLLQRMMDCPRFALPLLAALAALASAVALADPPGTQATGSDAPPQAVFDASSSLETRSAQQDNLALKLEPALGSAASAAPGLEQPAVEALLLIPSAALRQTPLAASAPSSQRDTLAATPSGHWVISLMVYALALIGAILVAYAIRHYFFALNRLFGRQRHPYVDIDTAAWPNVTIFIAAHNEEAVIAGALEAILEVDYPREKLTIMPVNDRSSDRTREIVDDFVTRFPGRITPFHRLSGKPGKAAALKDATKLVNSEIIVVFDADYLPSRGLIKQLVAPFFDPEVGATMGRVVPNNVGSTLLTRLLDLERAAGYQVGQKARMSLRLVPQYGGTVGGVRVAALQEVGGWRDDTLAEDTDLTCRLLLKGWKTVYQNRAECYEEVPENWPVRVRQIMRWARGHNQALIRYALQIISSKHTNWRERLDGFALLAVYATSPSLVLGWILAIALFYAGAGPLVAGFVVFFSFVAFNALGNFSAFFEIAAASYLDGSRARIRLLPLNYLGFLVSMVTITRGTLNQLVSDTLFKRELRWDKTVRYRKA